MTSSSADATIPVDGTTSTVDPTATSTTEVPTSPPTGTTTPPSPETTDAATTTTGATASPTTTNGGESTSTAEPESVPTDPTTTTSIVDPESVTVSAPASLADILATIRHLESGDYSNSNHSVAQNGHNGSGNPTGAYQFLYKTWNGYQGYDEAFLAPPAVQDARAAVDVNAVIAEFGADASWIPVVWYVGFAGAHAIQNGSRTLDWLPNPMFNTLTVGEYQARWMNAYRQSAGLPTVTSSTAPSAEQIVRTIVFPVAGAVTYYNDWGNCRGDNCERRHLGNDLIGQRLQPLLATEDGTIGTPSVSETGGNCLRLITSDGWSWIYCHLNNDAPGTDDGASSDWMMPLGLKPGDHVTAGTVIAFMGDSGNAETSVPHLHLELARPDDQRVDPFWSLQAADAASVCRESGRSLGSDPTVPAGTQGATWSMNFNGDWLAVDQWGGYRAFGTAVFAGTSTECASLAGDVESQPSVPAAPAEDATPVPAEPTPATDDAAAMTPAEIVHAIRFRQPISR